MQRVKKKAEGISKHTFHKYNSKKSKVTNINRKLRPETRSLFKETEWILEVCT